MVFNQTVELKPDSGSKMASPIGIATQFIQAFFFYVFVGDDVLLTSGNDKVDIKEGIDYGCGQYTFIAF